MAVARKIHEFMEQGSWIRKMFEEGIALKQQFGEDNVFDLSLGNPIMEPPPQFFEELRRIANSSETGMHRYMPNAGYPDARAAVAAGLARETGMPFTGDRVVLTCGAGGALNVIMKTLLDPGDEVVIFAPYFVEYMFYADNQGGTCRVAPTDENWLPDLDALATAITPKTSIVLVNSPNNPTGVVYSAEILAGIGEVIRAKEAEFGTEISLVSDEPYRKLLFDGAEYPQIFPHHPRSIVATSHSKDLALPGERIGMIAVSPDYPDGEDVVDGLTFCNRTLGFVNAPALMQWVIRGLLDASVDVGWYQRKRDYVHHQLTGMGYALVKPQGAFFAFPSSPIPDDVKFVQELLRWNVLVTPGTGFGRPGFVRISYCVEDRVLEGAMEGFAQAANEFGL